MCGPCVIVLKNIIRIRPYKRDHLIVMKLLKNLKVTIFKNKNKSFKAKIDLILWGIWMARTK